MYLNAHIKPVNEAFSKIGTPAASARRLGVQMAWGSVGRSS